VSYRLKYRQTFEKQIEKIKKRRQREVGNKNEKLLKGDEISKNMSHIIVKKFRFPVIVEIDEDGYYIVSCPLFKGCHTYGKTIEEALENIREVIELCIEEERLDESTKFVGYREIEIEYEITTDKSKRAP